MDNELKLPFSARTSLFFLGILALFTILYLGRSIIIPLVFAFIIAIVLYPAVNFFVQKKMNRLLAITFTLLFAFSILVLFGAFLISQLSRFGDSWPLLVDKFTVMLNAVVAKASDYLNVEPKKIYEWITKAKGELVSSSSSVIGQTLVTVGSGLIVLFLIPVYVFIILYYQPLLLEFIHRLFGKSNHNQVSEIVTEIKTTIQSYLKGLVIEAIIIAVLNSTGLLILGIDYAILLGIVGAVLNVIPYIGGIIAVALPMMVALVTKSTGWYAIYVLAIYYFIQLIDNHYIVPKIVASKVKINALFSIVVVLVGNALWGIPGMFLSIPLLAILKLIFDRIEPLKPWGFLLGDTMPPLKIKRIFKKDKVSHV